MARNTLAEASRRNAEALAAMGMVGRIAGRWNEANREYRRQQAPGERRRRRLRRDLEGAAHAAAVGDARRSAPIW